MKQESPTDLSGGGCQDGKMVSAKAPKKNKREIKDAWTKLQRALNAPMKKKYGYGVHALARA